MVLNIILQYHGALSVNGPIEAFVIADSEHGATVRFEEGEGRERETKRTYG